MGGLVKRVDPEGIGKLTTNPEAIGIFSREGWLSFFEQFQGPVSNIALEFPRTFNGRRALFQQLTLIVTNKFFSQAIGLPLQGE
jgi:hypothetical protein